MVDVALYNWMQAEGISYSQLARILRKSLNTIKYMAWGKTVPKLVDAFILERISNGRVPVSDWLKVEAVATELEETLGHIEASSDAVS